MSLKDKIKNIWSILNRYFIMPFLISISSLFILISILKLKVFNTDNSIILYTGLTLGFLSFFLWFKKIHEENNTKKNILDLCSHFFLISLVLITLSSFSFYNEEILKIIKNINPLIVLISIFSGFITFYFNREKINTNTKNDKIREIEDEEKRHIEFPKKFPELYKIYGLKNITIWIHQKGFGHVLILLTIIIIGLILRVYDLSYIQWSDNFNLISAKAFSENGNFYYNRNIDYTYLTGILFKLFNPSLEIARLLPVFIGTISIYLMYLVGRITVNKKVGLISSFLIAISPLAIEKSSIIREYTLNSFIFLLSLFFLFSITNKKLELKSKIILSSLLIFSIYIYSKIVNNTTLPIILFGLLIICFNLFFYQNKKIKISIIPITSILLLIFNFLISKFDNFSTGFFINRNWFDIFFNPNVNYPIQWFNGVNIDTIFIFFIFIIPITVTNNRKIIISYIIFFFYLLLFILKFQDGLTYLASRYLYHIHSIYILIFSLSLYFLYTLKKQIVYRTIIIIFIFMSIIIIPNTFLGATHYSNPTKYNNGNYPRVSSIGSRQDVKIFLDELDSLNIIKKNYPIVLEGLDQSAIIYKFDYNIEKNRYYVIHNGTYKYYYDIGKNIYIEDNQNNLFGLEEAIANNKEGVFITYKEKYTEEDFKIKNTKFTLIKIIPPKKIYRWVN